MSKIKKIIIGLSIFISLTSTSYSKDCPDKKSPYGGGFISGGSLIAGIEEPAKPIDPLASNELNDLAESLASIRRRIADFQLISYERFDAFTGDFKGTANEFEMAFGDASKETLDTVMKKNEKLKELDLNVNLTNAHANIDLPDVIIKPSVIGIENFIQGFEETEGGFLQSIFNNVKTAIYGVDSNVAELNKTLSTTKSVVPNIGGGFSQLGAYIRDLTIDIANINTILVLLIVDMSEDIGGIRTRMDDVQADIETEKRRSVILHDTSLKASERIRLADRELEISKQVRNARHNMTSNFDTLVAGCNGYKSGSDIGLCKKGLYDAMENKGEAVRCWEMIKPAEMK